MNENKLELKSIKELKDYNFFIPSYQRGYRWTEKNVEELLDDIWEFKEKHLNNKTNLFYCLQPIVIKENKDKWEVIDGQQRLTTIYLILKNIDPASNIKSISYETRERSKEYLEAINEKDSKSNIDFFHIYQANNKIKQWLNEKSKNNEFEIKNFTNIFLENTKIIWYAVTGNSTTYEIFTRLNMGKIQLTNAELIKALFLKKWNENETVDVLRLKQLQIATEWDIIENKLQEDSFWYFINNKKGGKNNEYPNRIDYIFDIMKKKNASEDDKYTFYEFYKDFEKSKESNKNKIPDVDSLWLEVKNYFLRIEEWYNNQELYHYIGYLINFNIEIREILELQKNKTKSEFKVALKERIKNIFKIIYDKKKISSISDFNYPNDKEEIKKILLLFNIKTIILSKTNSYYRFPFNLYKNQNWDIEHISSLSDKSSVKIKWLELFKEYFNDLANNNIQNHLENLERIVENPKNNDNELDRIYNELRKEFKEDALEYEDKNSISNLTILDSSTNRSYKNAFFPIKRKIIIEIDKKGSFIPICTKNVFMKAYSKNFNEIMYWNYEDAENYISEIKKTLKEFLPKTKENYGNEIK